jgi:signal peptidase I
LIVDELTYRFREPDRGEVIVFHSLTQEDDYLLKRVIAMPGERVKIESNKVIIYNETYPEGIVLEENYVNEETPGSVVYTLGADQYFVLGDNRDESYDSRRFGPVGRDAIVGRALIRGWPFHRIGTLSAPDLNL